MQFRADLEMTGPTARIKLAGELDASVAHEFKAAVERAAQQQPERLILLMQELEYIASAGLRVLIFAKQKMGPQAELCIVSPQEQVLATFEMTGIQQMVRQLSEAEADQL